MRSKSPLRFDHSPRHARRQGRQVFVSPTALTDTTTVGVTSSSASDHKHCSHTLRPSRSRDCSFRSCVDLPAYPCSHRYRPCSLSGTSVSYKHPSCMSVMACKCDRTFRSSWGPSKCQRKTPNSLSDRAYSSRRPCTLQRHRAALFRRRGCTFHSSSGRSSCRCIHRYNGSDPWGTPRRPCTHWPCTPAPKGTHDRTNHSSTDPSLCWCRSPNSSSDRAYSSHRPCTLRAYKSATTDNGFRKRHSCPGHPVHQRTPRRSVAVPSSGTPPPSRTSTSRTPGPLSTPARRHRSFVRHHRGSRTAHRNAPGPSGRPSPSSTRPRRSSGP